VRIPWIESTCPACGGPGVRAPDWRGETIDRCDAYKHCPEKVQESARRELARGMRPEAVRNHALARMAAMERTDEMMLTRYRESRGQAA
jgi:hypothetical protein